jgi:ABC-type lipoprotein export system ATPase subunit
MIQVNNLQKTFLKDGHRIEVLKGLDFEIAEGESLAVAGVSGAGKSTLIHIIGTLDHPTSGAVLFDGVDVFTWPEKRLAAFRNRKIGFVFQFHNLLPEFTALENAMMPALIQRMPKAEANDAQRRSSARWDWATGSPTNRESFPEGNNSGWPLPGRSSSNRRSCSRMNLRETLTRKPERG